ncbi:hypothetical protein L1987_06376 [Smallanthus sonchifolius]|uniref:Uncharacterized protein n=1 Tax=Smallanthus sonchifolius TaxID=185202 RepID=A0ACB9JY55_9ASTR|nr:hypothetical protein L1987_06376 [Smallanthus sonchifolius]
MTVSVTRKERKEEDGGIQKERKKRERAEKEERSRKMSRFSFDRKKEPVECGVDDMDSGEQLIGSKWAEEMVSVDQVCGK